MFKNCGTFIECMANSIKVLIGVAAATIAVSATGYAIFEDYKWHQNIEWAIQTMTSVGYGNYPAQTVGGSVWSMIMMLWGVVVILSLIVAVFVEAFRKDPDTFNDAEQDWIANTLTNIAEKLNIDVEPYPDSNKEN